LSTILSIYYFAAGLFSVAIKNQNPKTMKLKSKIH
jgi:hypothetical protein